MNEDVRQEAIALYDRFTHEGMERRTFMARMVAIAGSAAAAEVLIATIAADPAAAAIVPEDDKRLKTATIDLSLPGIPAYRAYTAEMQGGRRRPSVVIIHENRGLNAHTRDVARRMALAGFHAVAPDFLSPAGGTPADEDKAREMIGKLDLAQSVSHAVKHLELLRQARRSKVGAVGFCWGGGFVNRLAVAGGDRLGAGVVYYGPGPAPTEAAKVEAPLMIHHAGLDNRIAQTLWPWVTALRAADKKVTYFDYEGVNHAFNNDTSAERYNKAAADLAWGRTMRFFKRNLG
jgi:carboxymethylenebutenolidase